MRTSTWSRGARLGAATLVLVVAGGLAACGDDDEEEADTASQTTEPSETTAGDDYAGGDATGGEQGEAVITAEDFSFTSATAAPGAEVKVRNEGEAPHTVTADEGDAFDTGNIGGGEQGSFTAPDEAGTYPFHCEIHPAMTGTLTVEG